AHVGGYEMFPQDGARLPHELADVGFSGQAVLFLEQVRHFLLVLVYHRRNDVRRRLPPELEDVLAANGFYNLDTRGFERVVECALLAHHRLGFHGLAHAVLPRDVAYDAVYLVGGLRPMHDRTPGDGVALERLQIQIEAGEAAVPDRGSCVPYRHEVVELRHALRAPAHEVGLQLGERGLEIGVGELAARARLEVHRGDLHNLAPART